MDRARLDRIQEVFHQAADLPEPGRKALLDAACEGDAELRAEVQAMLDEDARGSSLLDHGVARLASEISIDDPALSALSREIGPYRILRPLGEGGMGVVYLAERTDVGSLVAIKLLRDAWLSPARRERFAREERMLAQLNHPSIARLYDAGTLSDGTPWFVMEYVDGLPLTEHCRRKNCTLPERLRIFRAVCEAVQYAHRLAVIHRDLKPSNILVKDDGSVRLLDFGIAKQLEDLETPVDQTRTGLRLMTPAYAAPEQARGERAGLYTDVYSLGVILYELLAGRPPFDLSHLTPAEAEIVLVQSDAARPSEVGKSAETGDSESWADLDVLCLTAMHKDVQRRYGSAEALIRDVDHYLAGEPLEARPDTPGYRMGKFLRRNRRAVAVAASLFVAVTSLVVFFTVRLASARTEAVAEAARTQRIQQFMLKLFEGGDKASGPSEDLRVVTLINRGVQEARNLDRDPELQAELYQTLGGIYQKLGDLKQADTLLATALERRRALRGEQSREAAETLVTTGLLRVDQARLEEAEKLVRQGLGIARQTLPPGHPDVSKALSGLGSVLEEKGDYKQAIQVMEEAVRLEESRGPAHPELASAIYGLANNHFYAGNYDESEKLNQRVLVMDRQLYGERHPLVSDVLINLGAIRFERGKYGEAEQYYRQGLEITQAWFGRDHYKTAGNLTMIGRSLVFQEKYAAAVETLTRSLEIQERVFGKVHPRVASAVNELGNIALRTQHYDEAEGHFRRMREIYRAVYADRHYLIGTATANLASVYLARKDYAHAEPLFREAIRRFTETQSATHLNTGIARVKLGRTLLRMHRLAEAETEILGGYEILSKQTSPSVTWMQSARQDLVALYEEKKQPEKAERYRQEIAAAKAK